MYLSFSRTSISMDCSSGTEMEQSVKTTRLSRDIGRGSWSLDANKRQAEASSCNWVLINDNETLKTVVSGEGCNSISHTLNLFCKKNSHTDKFAEGNEPFDGQAGQNPVKVLNCRKKNLGAAFLLFCNLGTMHT